MKADVRELNHPLVKHHISYLRDVETSSPQFRDTVYRLTYLLAYEATQDLGLAPIDIQTPLAMTTGAQLQPRVGLVPILRAGLGMVEPVVSLIPDAEIRHLGYYRNESTLEPVPYYEKLSAATPVDVALVLDPMLATGGSSSAALKAVRDWGVRRIKLLAIIAAPEGLERIQKDHPDVSIFICSIDSHLNENGFIVPGLGDAGDRLFNTSCI